MAMDPLAKRRQENIAGYVIALWQVEDMLRAAGLDMAKVDELLLGGMEGDAQARAALRGWYAGLVARMQQQGLQRSGHLEEGREVVRELEQLHAALLESLADEAYAALHAEAQAALRSLPAPKDPAIGLVERALMAVYGVMALRTKGVAITPATAEADALLRRFLDRLSQHYRNLRRLPGVSLN